MQKSRDKTQLFVFVIISDQNIKQLSIFFCDTLKISKFAFITKLKKTKLYIINYVRRCDFRNRR